MLGDLWLAHREDGGNLPDRSRGGVQEFDDAQPVRFGERGEQGGIHMQSLVDFVPDHEPYEFLTAIDLAPADGGTEVTMTMEPMHNAEWTQRLVAGGSNELDNLAGVLGARN